MHDRRSLLNFAILIVAAAAAAGFIVNRASEAIAEIDALTIYPPFSGRQKAAIDTSAAFTANPVPSNVEEWKTYRSEQYGFEVRYPPSWIGPTSEYQEYQAGGKIQVASFSSTSSDKFTHGLGIPPLGEMTVRVVSWGCESPNNRFVQQDYPPPGLFSAGKSICIGRFQIYAAYTNHHENPLPGPEKQIREELLETMLSTFKFTK